MICILDRNKLTSVEITSGFIAHLRLILLWIIDHIVNRGSNSPRIPFCKYISEIFLSTVTTFLIIFYILIKLYSLLLSIFFFLYMIAPFCPTFVMDGVILLLGWRLAWHTEKSLYCSIGTCPWWETLIMKWTGNWSFYWLTLFFLL